MPTATPGTPATITSPTLPAPTAGQRKPKLLNRLAETLRFRQYSRRAEQTYLREAGQDIRTIQALVRHTDFGTCMISTPVPTRGGHVVQIPVDAPWAWLVGLCIPARR